MTELIEPPIPTPASAGIRYITHWTPEKILEFRVKYHLSQINLAMLLGTAQQRVCEWETGKHAMKRPYSTLLDALDGRLSTFHIAAKGIRTMFRKFVLEAYKVEVA